MSSGNAHTSQPMPANGQRTLSAKETVQRAQALGCSLPQTTKPSCSGQTFLGIFFDGTGNNQKADVPLHRQSNVVRLFGVHQDNTQDLHPAPPVFYRREYIPGVGTPFPEIGEKEATKTGKAMANGGQSRIFWGLIQTINALYRYVNGGDELVPAAAAGKFAQGIGDGDSSKALASLKKTVATLKARLVGAKPTITQFNISVFGFSRGAAQARAYTTWFYELCEATSDGYTFAGIPARVYFLGIFDTVAAVGATSVDIFKDEIASGHAAWAKGTLMVHPGVERCVHFVASHEVRGCFPLDSVRYRGHYPGNCTEVVYPGVHSDIGGGYAPVTQGRSPLPQETNTYAFSALFPCIDMHKEALATGVPLVTLKQMEPRELRNFTASPQLISDYNNYIAEDKVSGSVEMMIRQRMHRYRHYRYKQTATFVEDAKRQGAPSLDAVFLKITNADFDEKCREFRQKYHRIDELVNKAGMRRLAGDNTADKRSSSVMKESLLKEHFDPDDLEMWQGMHRVGTLSPALKDYFDHYLHDSLAGFAQDGVHEYKFNGRGLFRSRTVYDKGGSD